MGQSRLRHQSRQRGVSGVLRRVAGRAAGTHHAGRGDADYGDAADACLDFSAYDAGLRELAFIVENRLLQNAAWQCLQHAAHVRLFCPARCATVDWSDDCARLLLEDRTELTAKLIVGADGADSWLRAQAAIGSSRATTASLA